MSVPPSSRSNFQVTFEVLVMLSMGGAPGVLPTTLAVPIQVSAHTAAIGPTLLGAADPAPWRCAACAASVLPEKQLTSSGWIELGPTSSNGVRICVLTNAANSYWPASASVGTH